MRFCTSVSLFLGVALACGLASAQSPGEGVIPAPSETDGVPADGQEGLNDLILAAIAGGRYGDAIGLARQAQVSQAEIDFAVGELILQGLSDPAAVQRPAESPDAALTLIERSALSGHRQAISALAATYDTGLRDGLTQAASIAPDASLQACWEAAKSDATRSVYCVAMRAGGRQ